MKYLLILLFSVFFLNSCAELPHTKEFTPSTKKVASGIFKAKTSSRNISGFFSISPNKSIIDISSPLGFALYGIYINNDDLYVKDYLTGAKFTNEDLNKLNIPKKDNILLYEDALIYFTHNFFSICKVNNNPNIIILKCESVFNQELPKFVEFSNKKDLLQLTFEKVKLENSPVNPKYSTY